VTIVRVGATKKYAEGWESAFGKGKKQTQPAKAAKKTTAKKSAKKSAGKRPVAKAKRK
jgi:hypothetical protein